jgi:hypothetical protein
LTTAAEVGSKNTLELAQLSNLSILLALASRLDDARAKSEEALSLAIRDLGRNNKYTRYANRFSSANE